MNCPSFERLIDFLDGRLQEADAAQIAAHLAIGCGACTENRDWYQRVRTLAASDDSIAPPAWVLKRAVRIFETHRSRTGLSERVGALIASLVFDTFARPVLAGVRSTDTASRQLLYSAGDYSVDVQIARPEQAKADLIGQVLKEGEASFDSVSGLKLNVSRSGKVCFSTVTDAIGEFRVSGVEPGLYELRIELSEGSITVQDLPVSAS